jgi:hypothetical protein
MMLGYHRNPIVLRLIPPTDFVQQEAKKMASTQKH